MPSSLVEVGCELAARLLPTHIPKNNIQVVIGYRNLSRDNSDGFHLVLRWPWITLAGIYPPRGVRNKEAAAHSTDQFQDEV